MTFLNASLTAAVIGATALTATANDHGDHELYKENGWFLTPHVGYLFDNEEVYAGVAVGKQWEFYEFYLQLQHTGSDDTVGAFFGDVNIDIDIWTISAGGSFHGPICHDLSYYLGGSAGIAIADIDFSSDFGDGSVDSESFYFDLKAGLQWSFNEHIALQTGLRYLFVSEFEDQGASTGVIDDLGVEVGLKIRF